MKTQWQFATVARNAKSKSKATWVNTDGSREAMPVARVLILVPESNGWGLYGYAEDGDFAGDTLHVSEEDAFEHARWAYGKALGRWQPISHPVGKLDHVAKALLTDLRGHPR